MNQSIKPYIKTAIVLLVLFFLKENFHNKEFLYYLSISVAIYTVVKLVIIFKKMIKTFNSMPKDQPFNVRITDAMVGHKLSPYLRSEIQIYSTFSRAIMLRPIHPNGGYSGIKGARYSAVFPLAILVAVIDIPIMGLIIRSIVHDEAFRIYIEAGLLFISVYALVWIIGDRRAMLEMNHSVNAEFLVLRLGVRESGSIPTKFIKSAITVSSMIDGSFSRWKDESNVRDTELWQLTPLDSPNLIIQLNGNINLKMDKFGYRKNISPRYVCLYVDENSEFCSEINSCLLQRNGCEDVYDTY